MKITEVGIRGQKIRRIAVLIILSLLLSFVWWMIEPYFFAREYASFTRSDGKYRVVVLRKPAWPASMPGQAGDAPGRVMLYNRVGELLHETSVEMVQLVQKVEWTEKSVSIKLIAEWDLPN